MNQSAQKLSRRIHRWLGWSAVVVVTWFSVTGMLINHASEWDWDARFVKAEWLLQAYGLHDDLSDEAPVYAVGFKVSPIKNGHFVWLSGVDGQLYFNDEPKGECLELFGADSVEGDVLAVCSSAIFWFDERGRLLEKPSPVQLPASSQLGVLASGGFGIKSNFGVAEFDPTTFAIKPSNEVFESLTEPSPLPEHIVVSIQQSMFDRSISWERVVLDLHAGRWLGPLAVLILDGLSVLLLIMMVTGVVLLIKRKVNRAT